MKNSDQKYRNYTTGAGVLLLGCRFSDGFTKKMISKGVDCIDIAFFNEIESAMTEPPCAERISRDKLNFEQFVPGNEFEHILKSLLPQIIPNDFWENFNDLYKRSLEIAGNWNYKTIYTAGNLGIGTLASIVSALQRQRGARIVDIQHSAVYALNAALGFYERQIFDRFITWGWGGGIRCGQIKPCAIARLPKAEGGEIKKKKGRILYASNVVEKFECGRGAVYTKYTRNHFRFFPALDKRLRKRVVTRIFLNDYTSDIMYAYRKKYKWVKLEDVYERSFYESAKMSDIVICDSYGSTHVEAMIYGCPTMFFMGTDFYMKNRDVEKLLKELHQVQVFGRNAEEAAEWIKEIDDFESWWNKPHRQEVVRRYLNLAAGDYRNTERIWEEEIFSG